MRSAILTITAVLAAGCSTQQDAERSASRPTAPPPSTADPLDPGPGAPRPAKPSDATPAQPSDEGWEFPFSLEGPAARHRSGGPYVPESAIEAAARASAGCPSDGQPAHGETRCERVVVKFFERYEDAYRRYASTGWQYVGTFAHDREVYLVTVYGHLGFCPKVPSEPGQSECPLYADHSNGIYDATTGEGGGGGTAGAPLE